jgi:hypothetical protein
MVSNIRLRDPAEQRYAPRNERLSYEYRGACSGHREGRPHVVILGAGASLQAFPDGDRKGQRLPLMYELVEVVGLRSVSEQQGIGYREISELTMERLS